MNFPTAISTCISKFCTFSGRASRSEFWWFYLFTCLVTWAVTFVELMLGGVGMIANIVSLFFLIPILAAGSRRLHDTDRSGWWQLLMLTGFGAILILVWWCFDTKPESNQHGHSPKAVEDAPAVKRPIVDRG